MPAGSPQSDHSSVAARARDGRLCLVVHDDLELRLRLAGFVRRAVPGLDSDSVTRAGFDSLPNERFPAYAAVLLIVEFRLPQAGEPLAPLERLRRHSPCTPVFVFARGGDERSAARAVKGGASDYWPIHAVSLPELASALAPLAEPTREPASARLNLVDPWRKPEIAGYRLIKTIAHSKAASVYLARNDDLEAPVALKVQPVHRPDELPDAYRQRFLAECQMLSTLNHRAIANLLDFGITERHLYLALEYFPCGSLRERLKNPVSEDDAVNYARQIGQALEIVHGAGIVHRDLKPSNVMITDDNRLVLIDFGSACGRLASGSVTEADLTTGTPHYACPEQIEGREPDLRGDLYSLGVMFYEMLAGTLPYRAATLAELFEAHRAAAIPTLPRALVHLQPVIDRLLAKQSVDRYASAARFLEALDFAAHSRRSNDS
jgi:tRNA A-37 threonylcarbamoyl transferase component Bud32